ncbi:MAG: hypothetical protein R3F65_04515 [bacterium]
MLDGWHCATQAGLRVEPLVDDAWQIILGVLAPASSTRTTGAVHARRVERFLTCLMARCAARNTWDGDLDCIDPDRDAIHNRCDVCPRRTTPRSPTPTATATATPATTAPTPPARKVTATATATATAATAAPTATTPNSATATATASATPATSVSMSPIRRRPTATATGYRRRLR